MSSLTRTIQKRIKKRMGDYSSPPQQFKTNEDGGYSVLHPTKGWRKVSAKRLKANGVS